MILDRVEDKGNPPTARVNRLFPSVQHPLPDLPDASTHGPAATDPGSDGMEHGDEDPLRPHKRRHVEAANGIPSES